MKIMKTYKIASIILLLATFFACEDVLDKQDLNVVGENIWDSETLATMYLNTLYENNMPDMSLGSNSGLTDEFFSSSESSTDFMYAIITPNDVNAVTVMHKDLFGLIRRINICLEGLDESTLSDSIIGRLKGQALFLRAMRNWEMVQLYGGIPLQLTVQDPYYDDLDLERSSTAASIQQIVDDLDEAIAGLPVDYDQTADKGRITSGAAAAFKGRILLHYASPMFNPNNDMQRWQDAYDANQQAIQLLAQMNTPRELYPDFGEVFTTSILSNPEAVIYKRYSVDAGNDYASGWEGSVRPPSGGGSGSYAPTWELVKAFPMANGMLITDANSGYDSTYFWKDRDPRFYQTIAYNGCNWEMSGKDMTTQWTYRLNIHENRRNPATGFYCRKATDPTIALENVSITSTSWHELRYAEVLLNFAECANEIGNKAEALENVRMIRARAGIEENNGTYGIEDGVSLADLRELIMIERQVEFAFENKRYWDLRRRKMYRTDLGSNVSMLNGTKRHGFTISANSPWNRRITDQTSEYYGWNRIDSAVYLGYVDINDADNYNTYFSTTYKEMEGTLGGEVQSINYLELYDFFAIPNSILQTSPSVDQTKGWLDGEFDPLAE